ncbi:MAG: hypothetical protein K2I91_04675, partial [Muribaculaceae bacterium]|nr:hypothetical protein [Muribaculaceae bacterium]
CTLTPFKDEATQTPYIIKGRVVSSDSSGNIYRMLVVQDETAALAISINRGSLYTAYPLGQEVVINLTDLWIGQYNNLIQLGWRGDYQGDPQISFMAYEMFAHHTQLNGLPAKDFKYIPFGAEAPADRPYCIVSTLEQISSIAGAGEQYRNMMSQLVEIPNVSFVDGGKETFAPYQDNADRYIRDASGTQLNVRCSGYSTFYNDTVPSGTGTVRGILSRYGDNWQLMLRDRNDVIFDNKGTKDDPYTVTEVIDMKNNGRSGWAKGYIIGSVRSGITDVTTNDDIIFNAAQAELDNNIVIGLEPDTRDLNKMAVVELPSGSKLRQYANLLDNPDVMGHLLTVRGTFAEFLGMNGIVGNNGGFADFDIEGVVIDGVTGEGNGTEDAPYSVNYILVNPDAQTDVWITGYIVGFVSGKDFATGAKFTSDTSGADYSGNNVIICATPDGANTANTIP